MMTKTVKYTSPSKVPTDPKTPFMQPSANPGPLQSLTWGFRLKYANRRSWVEAKRKKKISVTILGALLCFIELLYPVRILESGNILQLIEVMRDKYELQYFSETWC